ncbi:MFS transporter [Chloroflexota bacterium]
MPYLRRLYYGWIIIASVLIITSIILGMRHSFGVFFKSIESEFGLTRATTSVISSACMLLCAVFSIIGGWALDRYGPRITSSLMGLFFASSLLLTSRAGAPWQLFISYSLLLAIGSGGAYSVYMATATRWFDKRRGLALGIASSGGGLGIIVIAPLATYLIASYDWRMAYIILGGISGIVIISLSLLLKKSPIEINLLPDGEKPAAGNNYMKSNNNNIASNDSSMLLVFRTSGFWLLWLTWVLQSSCVFLITTHIIPHATDVGVSTMEAALVLSLIGISSFLGRILAGSTSDVVGRKTVSIITALLGAAALIWLIRAQELWMFYLFAVAFGISWGGLSTMVTVLIGEVFGSGILGTIMGWLGVAWFLGAAIGPAVGGLVFDVNNEYYLAFIIGAVAMLITAILMALLKRQEMNHNL